MRFWTIAACVALAAGAAHAEAPPSGLHMVGPGLYVRDLAAERAWFESRLGLSVVKTYPTTGGPDAGKPYEYVMSFGDGPDRAVLVLTTTTRRPPGPNDFVRVILVAPDAKGLAAKLGAQGVETHEVVPDVAYFLIDPEGNKVELYTPPKP